MQLQFSFIVPVFNRPSEIDELLSSLVEQQYPHSFEVVIVEDGSTNSAEQVVSSYANKLTINYLFKPNSGPGDSRNFGMRHAKGNYFIILDSDCIVPPQYLSTVSNFLNSTYVDCFGGPDAAHTSFSNLQKAINFAMTSFMTTGGIRGNKNQISKFQPRSFNMGLSKKAFKETGGFGNIHPGEDPDLSIRLWKLGYQTALITDAYVFHKRRISWRTFYKQVSKFGKVRPILNYWHPDTRKITYWFPSVFFIGFLATVLLAPLIGVYPLAWYVIYFIGVFFGALFQTKSLSIAIQSVVATGIQFTGYGIGFLTSVIKLKLYNKAPEQLFPELFFKNKS
ncbi:glycosyltransferase [Bizionia sediminis]|uniref:Glycosyltransferase n=1 Tax=Bizionia sediminis TaxID=1737064 RepID=A0ABW5KT10_9FLAO